MINKILEKVENTAVPLWQWCAGFVGILFVRFFLENISDPTPSFPGTPDPAMLVHYSLFYLGIFISLSLALRAFIPDISKITKFLFFGLPVIWLPPIVDLIISHGGGYRMAYLFPGTGGLLLNSFLHMGGSAPFGGVTPGLRVELIAILIGVFAYAFAKTKSFVRSFGATIATYLVWFFWLLLPFLIAAADWFFGAGPATAPSLPSLTSVFLSSHLLQNFIRPNLLPSYPYALETAVNVGISAVSYLFDFLLVTLWVFFYNPNIIKSLGRNLRLGRIAHYFGMIAVGALAAIKMEPSPAFANWVDIVLFVSLALAFFSAFLFAIGVNDLADTKIDRISNRTRPLPSGALGEREFSDSNVFFLLWLLVGGFICGYWALFTIIIFTVAYYLYSAPPLRLKRIPLVSSFLISLATLGTLMAGFYFVDANKLVSDFPIRFIALIIICITLAVNFKDIKDIAGDRADNIWTIPVVFGEERGKQVVGAMLAAAFLAVPAILGSWMLFLPSLIAAAIGYYFVIMKNYREWRIFALYFAYLGTVGALLWAHAPILH